MMGIEIKKRVIKVIVVSLIILLLGLGYYILCKLGYSIDCPLKYFTSIDCPFCGLTRMCISILEFRFKDAFYYNKMAFILLPIVGIIYLRACIRYIITSKLEIINIEYKIIAFMFICMIIYGLMRNIM